MTDKTSRKAVFAKNLDRDGYWWTHGFRFTKRHSIQTYLLSSAGHQRMASRKYIMGGGKAGKWHMGIGMKKLKLVNKLYSLIPPSTSHGNELAKADTGVSWHYLKADAPHDIAILPVSPINVKQPNGQILKSTKVYRLTSTTLPEDAI